MSVRADARRNRDRIVEVARQVFREQGYDASLDLIAKQAGVGPGTLYRHFPTRDDLVDAVMQAWVAHVEETADKALAHEGGPRDLLLSWFEDYVRLVSVHKGGPAKITGAMGDEASPIRTKCEVLQSASERVLDRLRAEDALRDDVSPLQVVRLVGGVATVADQSDLEPAAVRPMLEVLTDGLLK
jgi:AcrR family transcriptional regulator